VESAHAAPRTDHAEYPDFSAANRGPEKRWWDQHAYFGVHCVCTFPSQLARLSIYALPSAASSADQSQPQTPALPLGPPKPPTQAESGHGRQDLPGSISEHARRGCAGRLPRRWQRQGVPGDPAAAEGPDQGEHFEGRSRLRRRCRCRPRQERPRRHPRGRRPRRQVTNESEIEAKATTGFCCYTGAHFSARSRGRGGQNYH
jgi:hypothetical protein